MSATSQFTNAIAGSGKTYGRGVRFAVEEFLPYQHGDFWSNYPIRKDAMVAYVCKRHAKLKLDPEVIADRIKFFPKEVLASWQRGDSTPMEFFKDMDIAGAHIAIDEVHKFCNRNSRKEVIQNWQLWLGELRHDQATFECLSQHEMKVHKSIRDEAGLQRFMFNTEAKPDPFFGIVMGDWYELRAGFLTGQYRSKVVEAVMQDSLGKKVLCPELGRIYSLEPELFQLYDSYSGRDGSTGTVKARSHVFQTESKIGLLRWFMRRNAFRVFTRLSVVALVIWICFLGGISFLLDKFMHTLGALKPVGPVVQQEISSPPGGDSLGVFGNSKAVVADGKKTSEQMRIETLQAEVLKREKQIEAMKEEGARFAEVVALFDQAITLRCGVTVDVGEQIPLGPLKGRTIKGVSHAKRRVILDDGTVLPLSP